MYGLTEFWLPATEHEWNIGSTISIGAGLSIAFSIWWMYFDNLEGSPIRVFRERGRIKICTTWLYVHFPLVVGLVSTSAGIRYIVSSSQDIALSSTGEWLICGSVSLCLFSIAVIQLTTAKATENGDSTEVRSKKKLMIRGSVYRFIAGFAIVIIPVLTIAILPLVLILIITVICIIQIVVDLRHHPHHRIF